MRLLRIRGMLAMTIVIPSPLTLYPTPDGSAGGGTRPRGRGDCDLLPLRGTGCCRQKGAYKGAPPHTRGGAWNSVQFTLVSFAACSTIRRKEVIQPHVPVRLPCYDFAPVTEFTLNTGPHEVRLRVFRRPRLPWRDGRCVQAPRTHSPQHC